MSTQPDDSETMAPTAIIKPELSAVKAQGAVMPPAAHAPRRRRKPGENRQRLLEAGIHEFAGAGFRGAATTTIAQLAGVSQPHLYASYGTKLELFQACLDVVLKRIIDEHAAAPGDQVNGRDSCEAGGEASLENAQFMLQAIAASQEAALSDEVRQALETLRNVIGDVAWDRVVLTGARALLAGTQPN